MFKDLFDKRGYKKTDIGWVPIDWEIRRLKEIFNEIVVGFVGTISPYYCDKLVGVPFIRTLNVRDGRFDLEGIQYVTKEFHKKNRKSHLNNGDVLIARVGANMGMTCKVEGLIGEANSANVIIIKKSNLGDSDYYSYVIGSNIGQKQILTQSGGGAQAVFNTGQAQQMLVPYPPLSEQRRIAKILSTWDEAITLTEQLIAAKQHRKKALMQQLLTGRRRFREFEGGEWREFHLGEVLTERRETGFIDLPLLSVTDDKGIVYRDTLDRRDTSNEDKSKYLHACPGDIAYNTMRMWQGRSGVSKLEGIVSPAYTVCIPKASIDVNFIGYLFKFPPMVYIFWRYSQGLVSDTLSLKFDAFSKIKVKIPRLEEQRKIATVLQACDEEIELLGQKLAALKRQKQGLMQQLLTGRVRVKDEGGRMKDE